MEIAKKSTNLTRIKKNIKFNQALSGRQAKIDQKFIKLTKQKKYISVVNFRIKARNSSQYRKVSQKSKF